jgi:hypothetical protein
VGEVTDVYWFSAMLKFRVEIEGSATARYQRSVVLIRSPDFEAAFERAVERGRELESAYQNINEETVRWSLERVETIDQLEHEITEGREVYSEPADSIPSSVRSPQPDPKSFPPTQSGV